VLAVDALLLVPAVLHGGASLLGGGGALLLRDRPAGLPTVSDHLGLTLLCRDLLGACVALRDGGAGALLLRHEFVDDGALGDGGGAAFLFSGSSEFLDVVSVALSVILCGTLFFYNPVIVGLALGGVCVSVPMSVSITGDGGRKCQGWQANE